MRKNIKFTKSEGIQGWRLKTGHNGIRHSAVPWNWNSWKTEGVSYTTVNIV